MKLLSEILDVIGATQRDVENWTARLDLQLKFEPTVRGRARLYSRANTMELGLISALVRAGLPPSKALAHTRSKLEASLAGYFHEWIILPAGDPSRGLYSDEPNLAFVVEHFGPLTPPVYNFVRLGEVVRRVNALFAEA